MSKRNTTLSAEERSHLLKKLDSMTNTDVDLTDPDARPLPPEAWATARPFHEVYRPMKTQISVRIDRDVLDWLKSQGEGYQTRINQLLREQMLAAQRGKKKPA
jgi:uncharacterized protein (DUF4415 family)